MTDIQFKKCRFKNLNKKTWGLLKIVVRNKIEYFNLEKGQNISLTADQVIDGPEISSRLGLFLINQSKEKHCG